MSNIKFVNLNSRHTQILSLKPRQKWKPVIGSPSRKLTFDTDLHILQPTSIYVDIYKCVVEDDPRLPKIRIEGSLPDVTIRITGTYLKL